ncbi:MAG: hypothetical protein ACKVQV_08195 [Bacteroidia bacterium]
MNKLFLNLLILCCNAVLMQGCARIFIEDDIIKKWRSDPWGCNNVRDNPMMNKILVYSTGLDKPRKLKLLSQLGKPDTMFLYRGWETSFYYFGSDCKNGKPIENSQDGRLEVLQDSVNIIFSFTHF